jgi:preprotein translocase subunit SecA
MIGALAKKFFGTVNDRVIASYDKLVAEINAKESNYAKCSDLELKQQTQIFKDRLSENDGDLEAILIDAFAVCREAAKRTLNMRHFDVQLKGGIALHRGMIAEMRTGEGKTLVCTLPAYLNALTGKGVHVVTVNDYLAERDSKWMGAIHELLGLSVGCIKAGISEEERKNAYQCDITYGTNNEFGFDYLRDNLKTEINEIAQREFHYAIIDEVDSILIDEARTPLVISGPGISSSDLYQKISQITPNFTKEEYEIDEKAKSITLNDKGIENAEKLLAQNHIIKKDANLYDLENINIVHHINQALRATHLFNKDVDYIVKDDQVLIIDEFTGRLMEGRRFSDGLHQALEAKEKVSIQQENQTLASITFQNYFRNYPKLAGMTGTAMTEADEFRSTYKLDVLSIPTNMPEVRKDHDDEIYKTVAGKYNAIIERIQTLHAKGQPILVGTISIENSELIAKLLKKAKIKHNILNAKHHAKEAHIIAQAGISGAVTIATNMAGRGTDIMLGGNPEMLMQDKKLTKEQAEEIVSQDREKVLKAGGLFVLCTERHESRRIDNQLRGRAARQGDPGETMFYLSLEDDLMRIFGSEKIQTFLSKLGLKDDEALFHPWINKALEKAQKKVEGHNFEIRKNLIKYDDVMNEQRKVIYKQRREIIKAESVSGTIEDFRAELVTNLVKKNIPEKSYIENWNLDSLDKELFNIFAENFNVEDFAKKSDVDEREISQLIDKNTVKILADKKQKYGQELMQMLEKNILLMTLDELWRDHLDQLDHLKTGINLRAYGQKDPLNEYKFEAFDLFESMMDNLIVKTIRRLARAEINTQGSDELEELLRLSSANAHEINAIHEDLSQKNKPKKNKTIITSHVDPSKRIANDQNSWGKVGRNEACPCKSGKKFKYCHGKI